jgi:hypothetical protein
MRLLFSAHLIFASCCVAIGPGTSQALGGSPRSEVKFIEPKSTPPRDVASGLADRPQLQQASHEAERVDRMQVDQASYEAEPVEQTATPAPARTVAAPVTAATNAQSPRDAQGINQSRPPLGFYGGFSAQATMSQFPRRPPIQPNSPRPIRRQAKPFEESDPEPTISPYMHLDRDEDEIPGIPNYFAFVRPQMEQLQANRMRQSEIRHLRGVLQNMSAPPSQAARSLGTTTSARFMDTAQFYGSSR